MTELLSDQTDESKERVQMISYLSFTIPSLIGSGFVMLIILGLKLYSKGLNRIVFFISLADFLFSLPLELILHATGVTCGLLAFIHYYGIISSLYWTSLFAYIFVQISKGTAQLSLQKYFKWYLGVGLTLPLPWIAFLLITQYYDTIIGNFCYHSAEPGSFEYKIFIVSIFPPLLAITVTAICYAIAFFRLRKMLKDTLQQVQGINFMALFVFPLILIACWLPHIILYFLNIFDVEVSDSVQIPMTLINRLQGALNAVFYGLSPVVRQSLKHSFRVLCSKRQVELGENLAPIRSKSGVPSTAACSEY